MKNLAFFFISAFLIPTILAAEPLGQERAPAVDCYILKIDKTKRKKETPDKDCAKGSYGPLCSWPGKLVLALNGNGGSFHLFVRQDKRDRVFLPGGRTLWPQTVSSAVKQGQQLPATNDSATETVIVQELNGLAYVLLDKGEYEIIGSFHWNELPEYIPVPFSIANIKLTVLGKPIALPQRNERGEVWLRTKADGISVTDDKAQEPTMNIEVGRKLSDGIPQQLETVLTLRIGGVEREQVLGTILPAGFTPLHVTSPLSHKFDNEYNLILQLKPGTYEMRIIAGAAEPQTAIKPVASELKGWPAVEYWAWNGTENFRSVRVSGGRFVDPSRAVVPPEWKSLPLFMLAAGESLTFEELRRGTGSVESNELMLRRKFKLDTSGDWFTVIDEFTGVMNRGWRLNLNSEASLGRAESFGEKLLITKDPETNLQGVELRKRELALTAESRLKRTNNTYSAIGWATEVTNLSVALELPPGWLALWSSGSDNYLYTWRDRWTATSVMIIVLLSLVAMRLVGLFWGVGLLSLWVLSKGVLDAPVTLLFTTGAVAAITGHWQKDHAVLWGKRALIVLFGLLLLHLLSFTFSQAREIFAPNLAYSSWIEAAYFGGESFSSSEYDDQLVRNAVANLFAMVEGATGALVMVLGIVCSLISGVIMIFFKERRKKAGRALVLSLLVAFAAFSLRGMVSLFFGENYGNRGVTAEYERNNMAPQDSYSKSLPASPMRYRSLSSLKDDRQDSPAQNEQRKQKAMQMINQLDPNAVVQTGFGLANWSGKVSNLSWNGHVAEDTTFSLVLLPPGVTKALAALRLMLLWVLAIYLFRKRIPYWLPIKSQSVLVLIFMSSLLCPSAGWTEEVKTLELLCKNQSLPDEDPELVEKDPFACEKRCVTGEKLEFIAHEQQVIIRARVHAAADGAWGIPGPLKELYVKEVELDGRPTKALLRENDDYLWVRIPKGVHDAMVKAELRSHVLATLVFPSSPGIFVPDLIGWNIDGGHTANVSEAITLTRVRIAEGSQDAQLSKEKLVEPEEKVLPFWYRVKREINLSLPWTVVTTVSREGETTRPSLIRIPILKGESITSSHFDVQDSQVLASFRPGVTSVSWEGTLPTSDDLELQDNSLPFLSEEWDVECSELFSCESIGAPPLSMIGPDNNYRLNWKPWPAELAKLKIKRPLGVKGKTFTITQATLTHSVETREVQSTLTIKAESSQGGFHNIRLPDGAKLLSGTIDQRLWNFTRNGQEISLPLQPGIINYALTYVMEKGNSNAYLFPALMLPGINLNSDAVNVDVQVNRNEKERFLYFGSDHETPYRPNTLALMSLAVMLIVTIAISRILSLPLSVLSISVLALGFSLSESTTFAFYIAWLSAMAYLHNGKSKDSFNSKTNSRIEAGVLISSFILAIMLLKVCLNLVNELPQLAISGNGSTESMLAWSFDRLAQAIPSVQIIVIDGLWLEIAAVLWILWLLRCFFVTRVWTWSTIQQTELYKRFALKQQNP